ncbi:unnamed protein product [Vitrella brassicaformis CCMP3155]|uniref:Uncharacterized protein n=1 Tax=Vitrella brassicaformis (strain CCMP3155) TaxID=1169540 RepID=A0A0G4EYS0_VITBC|nr:unnamed protein product [Vitrella brassicaformis CCMP3155]|eukprot:CEM04306.1 unnamed protein product [Vitrella brassicaformis CCMP3155]
MGKSLQSESTRVWVSWGPPHSRRQQHAHTKILHRKTMHSFGQQPSAAEKEPVTPPRWQQIHPQAKSVIENASKLLGNASLRPTDVHWLNAFMAISSQDVNQHFGAGVFLPLTSPEAVLHASTLRQAPPMYNTNTTHTGVESSGEWIVSPTHPRPSTRLTDNSNPVYPQTTHQQSQVAVVGGEGQQHWGMEGGGWVQTSGLCLKPGGV